MKTVCARILAILVLSVPGLGQQTVNITVSADHKIGQNKPIWAYFGYDEPNYTYAPNGRKLIGELASLSPVPVFVRAHNLLTTGDGTAALKWGSTNAYTEDAHGNPVYDWTIVDRIFDTYVQAGVKPFVEIGFMPEALSTHPEPYRHDWPQSLYLGWTYPPRDYAKWRDLVGRLAAHALARYGRAEVETWYWEVWNEPDIGYWHGTPEEYDRLYDEAVEAVKAVLPTARVGGPATTGPSNPKAAEYLRQFLRHCAEKGVPLDFITFHAKGAPTLVDGHVRMSLARELNDVEQGIKIVTANSKFRDLPIILSEADPEGCAACSARKNPQNAYRNGPLYPCYTAAALNRILQLADRDHAHIEGMLTWAFEFEDQPYFEGFRTLATNGINKPVLNLFRMAGLLKGDRVDTVSDGSIKLAAILQNGVREQSDVGALATRSEHTISVMVWNYHDDDQPGPDARITLRFEGLPAGIDRAEREQYRIDATHSNAYSAWLGMGSPQQPDPQQYTALESAGQLQLLGSPAWIRASGGKAKVDFILPRQGVSLFTLNW